MSRAPGSGADLFSRPWTFLRGIARLDDLPPPGPPEIAFAGRSNVGKSSLINAVLAQKGLARTSNTPGRTQELNIFIPEAGADSLPAAVVVDMPGYGYAAAPKEKVVAWTAMVLAYLRGRPTLKRVFLLVDSRHGIAAKDREVLDLLDRAAVSYQVVLTKCDKPKAGELSRIAVDTRETIGRRPAAHPTIIATSAQAKTGIETLRQAIGEAVTG